jgi:hypothetical protein
VFGVIAARGPLLRLDASIWGMIVSDRSIAWESRNLRPVPAAHEPRHM